LARLPTGASQSNVGLGRPRAITGQWRAPVADADQVRNDAAVALSPAPSRLFLVWRWRSAIS